MSSGQVSQRELTPLLGGLAQARWIPGGIAPSEKQWEAWVIEAFRAAGCIVVKLSQPRATMQTEGTPDLFVMCPRRHAAFWYEVKRPGQPLRPAQQRFRELALACGQRHYWGALAEAKGLLAELHLLADRGG